MLRYRLRTAHLSIIAICKYPWCLVNTDHRTWIPIFDYYNELVLNRFDKDCHYSGKSTNLSHIHVATKVNWELNKKPPSCHLLSWPWLSRSRCGCLVRVQLMGDAHHAHTCGGSHQDRLGTRPQTAESRPMIRRLLGICFPV